MNPRIEMCKERKLVGKRLKMSLVNNKTGELWSSFMAEHKMIKNKLSLDKISMNFYPSDYFSMFNPISEFEKFACVEVSEYKSIPVGCETYTLENGLYAVFDYKGLSTDSSIFQYIFGVWIPNSDYAIDDRPHFEILGDKYKNSDPNSEEEIWIPILKK